MEPPPVCAALKVAFCYIRIVLPSVQRLAVAAWQSTGHANNGVSKLRDAALVAFAGTSYILFKV